MDKSKIRKLFLNEYNGAPNFMTPTIANYLAFGRFVAEVSHGSGMFGFSYMVGVTILEHKGKGVYVRRTDINNCFSCHSLAAGLRVAERYAGALAVGDNGMKDLYDKLQEGLNYG